jgi:hypothetical protein
MEVRAAAVVLVALLLAGAQAADKGASITLKAKWNGTSYLMEAAEFLVGNCSHLFSPVLLHSGAMSQPSVALNQQY